jgi:hypothetical protein
MKPPPPEGPLRPGQLIFTHVEADQSPARRGGHQVLFYTRDRLPTPAEVFEVERRLFYLAGGEAPTKRVFFTTPAGVVVVANVVALSDADALGRRGRYFAHALLFAAEEFARLGNNPFPVFERFPFLEEVKPAQDRKRAEEVQGSSRDPRDIGPPAEHILTDWASETLTNDPNGWAGQADFARLWRLGARAEQFLEGKRSLAFSGAPAQMYELLRVLFELLPPAARARCTFDTHFQGGTLGRTPYWAVGLPAGEARQANVFTFDLAARRFLQEPPCPPGTAAEEEVLSRPHADLASWRRGVALPARLEAWLDGGGRDDDLLGEVDEELFGRFLKPRPALPGLEKEVQEQLSRHLGPALAGRDFIRNKAWAWVRRPGATVLGSLREGLPLEQVAGWALGCFRAEGARRPAPEELEGLERLVAQLRKRGPRELYRECRLVCLRWAGAWERLAEKLRAADDAAFRQFVYRAMETALLGLRWQARFSAQGVMFGPCFTAEQPEDGFHLFEAILDARAWEALLPTGGPGETRPIERARCLWLSTAAAGQCRRQAGERLPPPSPSQEAGSHRAYLIDLRASGRWEQLAAVVAQRGVEAFQVFAEYTFHRSALPVSWALDRSAGGLFFGPYVSWGAGGGEDAAVLGALLGVPEVAAANFAKTIRRAPAVGGSPFAWPRRWPDVLEALASGERADRPQRRAGREE